MTGDRELNFRCELCGEPGIPVDRLLAHMQQSHPGQEWPEIETWPDGGPVIVDETLEPGDFAEGGADHG